LEIADTIGAVPIRRDDSVDRAENWFDPRQYCESEKRPTPPNSPRNFQNGIGASGSVPICQEQANFRRWLSFGRVEPLANPRSLKWRKRKTVPAQSVAKEVR
jgi:hypothetical protein